MRKKTSSTKKSSHPSPVGYLAPNDIWQQRRVPRDLAYAIVPRLSHLQVGSRRYVRETVFDDLMVRLEQHGTDLKKWVELTPIWSGEGKVETS